MLAVAIVGLSACQTQRNKEVINALSKNNDIFEEVLVKIRAITPNSASSRNLNSYNAYEWVGVEHNYTLDYVFNSVDFATNQPINIELKAPYQNSPTVTVNAVGVSDQIYTYTQKYWNNTAIPQNLTIAQYASLPVISVNSQRLSMNGVVNWLKNNKFEDPCTSDNAAFLQSIYQKLSIQASLGRITTFEVHADSILVSHLLNENNSEEDLKNIIIAFENDIISSELPVEVKDRQLLFASIFRNSLEYWFDAIDNPSHKCHAYMSQYLSDCPNATNQKGRWKKILKGICTGFCDAVGGLLGGGVAGSLGLGPWGVAIFAGTAGATSSAFAASFFD